MAVVEAGTGSGNCKTISTPDWRSIGAPELLAVIGDIDGMNGKEPLESACASRSNSASTAVVSATSARGKRQANSVFQRFRRVSCDGKTRKRAWTRMR